MKLELEDNTQEAFQFLLIGAAIVLVVRIAIGGIGLWLDHGQDDPLQDVLTRYRNGYLTGRGDTIIISSIDVTGRLAVAAMLAIGTGILLSAIAGGVATMRSRPAVPAAVNGARAGLLLAMLLFTYSALFLPERSVVLEPGQAVIRTRPSLFGTALPLPADEERIPWQHVARIDQRSRDHGTQACGVGDELVLVTTAGDHLFARIIPSATNCDEAMAEARSTNAHARELITARYLDQDR